MLSLVWSSKLKLILKHSLKQQCNESGKTINQSLVNICGCYVCYQARVRIQHPEVTISVIQELIRRDVLESALAGRTEKSLASILRFLLKYVELFLYNMFCQVFV